MKRTWLFCTVVAVAMPVCGDAGVSQSGSTSTTGTTGTTSSSGALTSETSLEPSSSDSPTTTSSSCAVEPVEGDCNPWCQDCPAGQECRPVLEPPEEVFGDSKYVARCFPLPEEPAGLGDACTWNAEKLDNCDKGAICSGFENDQTICVPLCSGTPSDPDCPSGTRCVLSANNVLGFCAKTCSPLTQDCPVVDFSCTVNSPDCDGLGCLPWGLRDTPFCSYDIGQATQYGEACGAPKHCAGGLACVSAEKMVGCGGPSCCTPFCDLNNANFVCPEAENGIKCLPAFQEQAAPAGLANLGICRLP